MGSQSIGRKNSKGDKKWKHTRIKKIIVIRKTKSDKDHPYSVINVEASNKALAKFEGNYFKFWYYLASNQDNFEFALSCVACCNELNISKNTYHRAVTKLKEQGYLVPIDGHSNKYAFYDDPDTKGAAAHKLEDITVYMMNQKTCEEGFEF